MWTSVWPDKDKHNRAPRLGIPLWMLSMPLFDQNNPVEQEALLDIDALKHLSNLQVDSKGLDKKMWTVVTAEKLPQMLLT